MRPADLEHVGAGGGRERRACVLLDDQDRGPLALVQLADDPEDLGDDERRETERRLVEEQEPRPLHHRAREREHLLLAARERARLLGPALLQPREVVEHAAEVVAQRAAAGVRAETEVLPDGELDERAAALRHVRDAEPRGRLGAAARERLSRELERAGAPHGARDRAQRRRLARAVRAEDRDDLPFVHRQADPAKGLHLAIARIDVAEFEQRPHAVGQSTCI